MVGNLLQGTNFRARLQICKQNLPLTVYTVALSQLVTAYNIHKCRRKAGRFYHMNDNMGYLGKQKLKGITQLKNSFCASVLHSEQ